MVWKLGMGTEHKVAGGRGRGRYLVVLLSGVQDSLEEEAHLG